MCMLGFRKEECPERVYLGHGAQDERVIYCGWEEVLTEWRTVFSFTGSGRFAYRVLSEGLVELCTGEEDQGVADIVLGV